jgi:tetratricopeptide (TPR) repeat protein
VGEFIGKHYVAAYQQAGDFTVVNVNGRIQRNGGNVASYFCTADGNVIHAVGKAVSADRLLYEARWALETYNRMTELAGNNPRRLRRLMAEAHLTELNTTRELFEAQVKQQLPRARRHVANKGKKTYGRAVREKWRPQAAGGESPIELARRLATDFLQGDRAHIILAANPFARFRQVKARLFKELANETYAAYRRRVLWASQQLDIAKSRGRPILLVLYRGHGMDKSYYDPQTRRLLEDVFRDPRVARPLSGYVRIALPLSELAALSTVADIPSYELPGGNPPILIVTGSDGKQVDAHSGRIEPDVLANMLLTPLNESRIDRATALAKKERLLDAMRLLKRVLATKPAAIVRQRAQQQINRVYGQMAERAVTKGDRQRAIGYLRRVVKEAVDEDEKARAAQRIEDLRELKVAAVR